MFAGLRTRLHSSLAPAASLTAVLLAAFAPLPPAHSSAILTRPKPGAGCAAKTEKPLDAYTCSKCSWDQCTLPSDGSETKFQIDTSQGSFCVEYDGVPPAHCADIDGIHWKIYYYYSVGTWGETWYGTPQGDNGLPGPLDTAEFCDTWHCDLGKPTSQVCKTAMVFNSVSPQPTSGQ